MFRLIYSYNIDLPLYNGYNIDKDQYVAIK